MYTMSGITVSEGVSEGRAFILRGNDNLEVNVVRCLSASEEILNYKKSSKEFAHKLNSAAVGNVPEKLRDLFAAFSSYITNVQNINLIESKILSGLNAKEAAEQVLLPKIVRFSKICDDSNLSLCQIKHDLLNEEDELYASSHELNSLMQDFLNSISVTNKDRVLNLTLTEPSVIIAKNLTPANFLSLDIQLVRALVLEEGDINGHLSAVLRDLRIPAVFKVKGALTIKEHEHVLVDANEAHILIAPPKDTARALIEKQDYFTDFDLAQDNSQEHNNKVIVAGSMGAISDAFNFKHYLVHGLGLLRSEFLFLNYQHEPTCEEMQKVFAEIFAKIPLHAPLTARTFDFAGDKRPLFSVDMDEEGPLRKYGAQVGSNLLRNEIKALLLASKGRDINIIFPLITRISEAKSLKNLLYSVIDELKEQNYAYGNARVGLMIETPAAVLSARAFAEYSDMFMIGTSSLAEYAAAPRAAEEYFTPALSKMIAIACKAAHDEGVSVGIAGRFAMKQELIPFYLALGVSYITTDASSIGKIRKIVQSLEDSGKEPKYDVELYNNIMEIASANDLQRLLYQDDE